MNRPIHLARRDAFFDCVLHGLSLPLDVLAPRERLGRFEKIIGVLKVAERHAVLATRAREATDGDRAFLRFLRLFTEQVASIHAMISQQVHLDQEEGFLCQFLAAQPDQCLLPAMQYQRRAEDLLQGVMHTIQLASGQYSALRTSNLGTMSAEDRARYNLAYESFHRETQKICGANLI